MTSAFLPALGMLLLSATLAGADAPADWYYAGTRGPEFASGQQPPTPISKDSPLNQDPIVGVLTQYRDRPMHYHFTVPAGTYRVRVHYLQSTGATKNLDKISARANGTMIVDHDPMWVPRAWGMGNEDYKEIPADVVGVTKEAEVAAKDGAIVLDFPFGKPVQEWGISGIEVVGSGVTVRVRCGSDEAYTDTQGNRWEADGPHYRPVPPTASFDIGPGDPTKGKWINVSEGFFKGMSDQAHLAPLPRPWLEWRVICDLKGHVYVGVTGIGLWSYDFPSGHAARVDGGNYAVDPGYGRESNPLGSGVCLVGNLALNPKQDGVISDDGEHFDPVPTRSAEFLTVDWTSTPHVIFITMHDTNNGTAVSVDGGKTLKELGDRGNAKYGGIGAIGGGVLLKCQTDGKLLRSTDLGATWSPGAELAFTCQPYGCFIQRLGDTVFMHTWDGTLFQSKDMGITWTPGPKTPGFGGPIIRGKGEKHLLGFGGKIAYESLDEGQTWTKAVSFEAGLKGWSYDPVLDAFYVVQDNNDILRYAR